MAVVTHPAASVARAPIDSRASSIGSVNVIASATLAYAGHDERMINPAAAIDRNPDREASGHAGNRLPDSTPHRREA